MNDTNNHHHQSQTKKLLLDHLFISSMQEGFLFGTVEEKQVEIISDSSESSVEPETVIRKNNLFIFV